MGRRGKFKTRALDSQILDGEARTATLAGTSAGIRVLLWDRDRDILLATGTDVPSDATDGYAKGCIFIDRDVATGISGVYENVGTNSSCNFDALTATYAEINSVCDANTATAAEIVAAADVSVQAAKVVPSSVITASAASVQTSVIRSGNVIKTTIAIDLTGLKSTATGGDIIGDTGVSYIAQITTAVNGIIIKGLITCGEVPTTGDDDIDLYSATEDTGAYDGAIGDLTETALMTAGGALAIGTDKSLTALPAADEYLYLTTGDATGGTYDAGKIMIELWGTVS